MLAPVNSILRNTLQFLIVFFSGIQRDSYALQGPPAQWGSWPGAGMQSSLGTVTIKILSLMLLPSDGMLKSYMILKGKCSKLWKRNPLTNKKDIENKVSYRRHGTGNNVRTLRARVSLNSNDKPHWRSSSTYVVLMGPGVCTGNWHTVWVPGAIFVRWSPELPWVSCRCLCNGWKQLTVHQIFS